MKCNFLFTLSLFCVYFVGKATAEEFPFIEENFDANGKLAPLTFEYVRNYRDDTIGDIVNKNGPEKDSAAKSFMLGYPSEDVESKPFQTEIDLTGVKGFVYVAIHVDDIANLTVTEKLSGEQSTDYTPFSSSYDLKGSALWRTNLSYNEFPNPIPSGRKYDLKLNYKNTVNLTKQYNGKIDYDGVSVFLVKSVAMVKEISFQGADMHTLITDQKTKTFTAPHYTIPLVPVPDEPKLGRRYPVAYAKWKKPTVKMKFEIDAEPETVVSIKATGTDDVNLPEQSVTILAGQKEYTYEQEATNPFPDQIRFYGPGEGTFAFDWQIKINEGEYRSLVNSKHRIYLTAGVPSPTMGNRETLFYYACHRADKDSGSDGEKVTDLIWKDFETKEMKRIDHQTGLSYGDNLKFNFSGGNVLATGQGICGDWSEFFQNVLAVHNYASDYVKVDSIAVTLPGGIKPVNSIFWLVSDQVVTSATTFSKGSTKPGPAGINRGQGSAQRSDFWNSHAIAKAFGKFYDPSYGIGKFPSVEDYEKSALSGFSYQTDPVEPPKYIKSDGTKILNYNPPP